MTPDQLKASITELVVLLQELDKLVPAKVDDELITFLQSLDQHPWLVILLAQAMTLSRQLKKK